MTPCGRRYPPSRGPPPRRITSAADGTVGSLAGGAGRGEHPPVVRRSRLRRRRLGAGAGPGPLAVGSGVLGGRRSVPVPDTLRPSPARCHGRPFLVGARRRLLPVRRVARRHLSRRHRGLLLPAHLRDQRRVQGPVRRPRPGGRGDVRAAAGPDPQAEPHRRLPALGLHRRRLEPRRPVAARPHRDHRPGPDQRSHRRLSGGDRRLRRGPVHGDTRRRRTEDGGAGVHRRSGRARLGPAPRRRRQPRVVDGRDRRTPAVVAAGAGGRAPRRRVGRGPAAERRAFGRRAERSPAHAHRAPPGRTGRLGVPDQR